MTGGAAAGDFDGDGWVDLYVTRADDTDILYRNRHDGTFEDVTASAFGGGHLASVLSNGAAWGDIDNDGDLDLYVTAHNTNRYFLFVNDGAGHFTEQGVPRGAAVQNSSSHTGMSVSLGDYDRDGFLDLFTAEWGQQAAGVRTNNRLLHNQGASRPGYFEDVTIASGTVVDRIDGQAVLSNSFTPRFSDLDGDHYPDLAITGDFGQTRLFWNNHDGTFTDGTISAAVNAGMSDMGSTIGDFDGDGRLDWFIGAHDGQGGDRLFYNLGNRQFTNLAQAQGVRNGGWGWGSAFFDFDNDGDLDIIMTNGWTTPDNQDDRTRLWRNDGGTFTEIGLATGITDTGQGRGLLTFDYDRDGDLDVFIVNNGGAPILYRNNGNEHNWLRVKTLGTESNAQGIGAFITVVPDVHAGLSTQADPDSGILQGTQFREVNAGSDFLAQSETTAHFGLQGQQEPVDVVTVRWPSGTIDHFFGVGINQEFIAREGQGSSVGFVLGDLDGNGVMDTFDVDEFESALADPTAYMNAFPDRPLNVFADFNGDNVVNAFDVDLFESLLSAPGAALPEPGSGWLVFAAGWLWLARSKRGGIDTNRFAREDVRIFPG